MRIAFTAVTALLLTSCSTSAVICDQWRRGEITNEKALMLLGIDPAPIKSIAKYGAPTIYSDGTVELGNLTATIPLQVGDEFEIKLGRKQIRLVPVGGSDEEGEE